MSKWYERHHEFLLRETTQLQTSSRYKEKYQKRDNLLVSTGEFVVRVNGANKIYPATFVYLESTPYALPRVYLTTKALSEEEIIALAKLDPSKVQDYMTSRAEFHMKRHQNFDGSLCLLEEDNLDRDGIQAFHAKEVISRVHAWLQGLSTGNFPQDNGEIELFAHYPKRSSTFFLVTEDFLRPNLSHGEYYFQTFKINQLPIYHLGACLIGSSISGLYLDDNKEDLALMPTGLKSREQIATNTEILRQALENGHISKGYWWQLDEEPEIYAHIYELAQAIGKGNLNVGQKLLEVLYPQVREYVEEIPIGLRFLNRRGEIEWLMITLKKSRSENIPTIGFQPEKTIEVLKDYDLVAVPTELFTEESYFLRNQGRVDRNVVKSNSVSIVGCGALGGEMADCIGKAGIGQLYLNDNQLIHSHNSVRHIAGIDYLGFPKSLAVENIVQSHNRFIYTRAFTLDVMMYSVDAYIAPEGIIISCIANDNTELNLNEQLVERKRTGYYVRALRGGKAARIFRVKPGIDACFYCLTLHRRDKHPDFINIPDDEALPTLKNECNNPIRPSSGADLKMISAMAARWILEDCLGNETKINHWVWISEPELGLGVTSEFSQLVISKFLPVHSECPLCRPKPAEIKIKRDALEFMQRETLNTSGIETGGVLLGTINESGSICIEKASGPGPNAVCSRTEFVRDTQYCQEYIDDNARLGLRYVGEWHSHPNENNKPSSTDVDSLTEIAQDKNYLTTTPVMIIFKSSAEPSCTIHPNNEKYYSVPLRVI